MANCIVKWLSCVGNTGPLHHLVLDKIRAEVGLLNTAMVSLAEGILSELTLGISVKRG